ncbi:hypothetical protein O6H91_02G143700 [Diphasiastrum complanatum]|uniref:Uncharacterized protein n=1 Tax=Diphasiastrum complanatum TaxID=34168 RepID=A0ACC2ELN7_DIPCM|nr:hypothetical protein O6H91_02G143700 [Diphasiastrum complanatum]
MKKEKMTESKGKSKWRPHVVLEWDEGLKKVVAKRTLVGLSGRNYSLCKQTAFQHQVRSGVADVLDAPQELFALKDLADVLSFQTWNTVLSDSERDYLGTFLPKDCDMDHVVRSLLGGENINFGNPLSSWGTSVCNGAMHPDIIIERDAELRRNRRAYYHRLRSYHGNMVVNLQELKEIWRTSKSPEKELPVKFQKWMKSRSSENTSTISDKKLPHQRDEIRLGKRAEKGNLSPNGILVSYTTRDDGVGKDYDLYLRQTSKRRRSGLSSEVSERENTSNENAGNEWSNTLLSTANISEDVSFDCMRALKVSRKTFAEIMEKNNSGEELHIDSVKSVLGTMSVDLEQGLLFKDGANSQLTDQWGIIVHKDLPLAHKTWREWKLQSLKFAKSIAEQCILQLPQVLQFPFEQVINAPFDVNVAMESQPSNLDVEETVLFSDGQTSSVGRSTSFESNLSESMKLASKKHQVISEEALEINTLQHEIAPSACLGGGSLPETDSRTSSGDQGQKLLQHSLQNLKEVLVDNTSCELALMPPYGDVRLMEATMEGDSVSNSEGQLVTQSNSEPGNFGSEDVVASEDEEVSAIHQDDEVSAIHQIWSTESPDTRVLSSGQGAASSVNESDTFISVKCPSYWETSINPAKSLDATGLIRGGVAREEAEQCDILHVEHECAMENSQLFEPQQMLPPAPCKEHPLIGSPISSSVNYVDDNGVQGTHVFYQGSDLVTAGNKASDDYDYQTEQNVMAQFFPTAVTTEKSDTSWKFPGSSSQVPSEVTSSSHFLQMEHHFNGLDRTQPFTPRLDDPEEASLRLELDINHSSLSTPNNLDEAKGMQSFSNGYELGHRRKEQVHQGDFCNSVKPELQLLTGHDSIKQKSLPHWAHSSQIRETNQHSSYQLAPNIPSYHDRRTQHVVDLQQEQMQQRVSQPCSALHLNSAISNSWSPQAARSNTSENAVPFSQMGRFAPSWDNGNNFMQSRWASAEERSCQPILRPPQRVDNRSTHSFDHFTRAPSLVGYGSNRHENGMGAFTSNIGPISPQGEWATPQSLPPTDVNSYNQNSSPYSSPGYGWMSMPSTRSQSSTFTHHNPTDPSCHSGSQSSGLQPSWVHAGGIKNGQLHSWVQNVHRHPP